MPWPVAYRDTPHSNTPMPGDFFQHDVFGWSVGRGGGIQQGDEERKNREHGGSADRHAMIEAHFGLVHM